MSDDKWLLTEVEVQKLLLDDFLEWPIGLDDAIEMGARAQLAKLRRLGWQEPNMSGLFMSLEGSSSSMGCVTEQIDKTYLWTKRGIQELKLCKVQVIVGPFIASPYVKKEEEK